jgi:hypothetical protein
MNDILILDSGLGLLSLFVAIFLQYGLSPLESVAAALTLAVKQAFLHGPRPDRPETC